MYILLNYKYIWIYIRHFTSGESSKNHFYKFQTGRSFGVHMLRRVSSYHRWFQTLDPFYPSTTSFLCFKVNTFYLLKTSRLHVVPLISMVTWWKISNLVKSTYWLHLLWFKPNKIREREKRLITSKS